MLQWIIYFSKVYTYTHSYIMDVYTVSVWTAKNELFSLGNHGTRLMDARSLMAAERASHNDAKLQLVNYQREGNFLPVARIFQTIVFVNPLQALARQGDALFLPRLFHSFSFSFALISYPSYSFIQRASLSPFLRSLLCQLRLTPKCPRNPGVDSRVMLRKGGGRDARNEGGCGMVCKLAKKRRVRFKREKA